MKPYIYLTHHSNSNAKSLSNCNNKLDPHC